MLLNAAIKNKVNHFVFCSVFAEQRFCYWYDFVKRTTFLASHLQRGETNGISLYSFNWKALRLGNVFQRCVPEAELLSIWCILALGILEA